MSNDFVQVLISIDSVGLTRQGYGMPLVLSHTAAFPDKVRFYGAASDVAEDFADDSPEMRYATSFFAQSPKMPQIAIGNASSVPITLIYTIGAGASPMSSTLHTIAVKGEGFDDASATYTSGASATAEQINNGLLTALNAVAGKNYLAAFASLTYAGGSFTAVAATDVITRAAHGLLTGDGPVQVSNSGGALPAGLLAATNYYVIKIDANTFYLASSLANALAGTRIDITDAGTGTHSIAGVSAKRPSSPFTVTGSAPGEWFSLALERAAVKANGLVSTMSHASPAGLASALDDILDDDGSWYQLHIIFPSDAYAATCATWAELNERQLVWASSDTAIIRTAISGATDIGANSLAQGYSATAGMYYPDPAAFAAGRWMGVWLPTDPGQATAALKQVQGLPTVKLTSTEKTNLKNRRMQSYIPQYGIGVMSEGMVFSTVYRFLDVRRDVDWLTDELRKSIFGILAGSPKVPYTPSGYSKFEGSLRGTVGLAETKGVLAEGTTNVEMPEFDAALDADKADRILRNAKISGTLQGAVHYLIPVRGTITF